VTIHGLTQSEQRAIDRAEHFEALSKKLQAELDEIKAALVNFELNGSDAVAQIKGMYSDMEWSDRRNRELRDAMKTIRNTVDQTL
jgi:predicted  nucleic acid-binding Zn-ribbon protein